MSSRNPIIRLSRFSAPQALGGAVGKTSRRSDGAQQVSARPGRRRAGPDNGDNTGGDAYNEKACNTQNTKVSPSFVKGRSEMCMPVLARIASMRTGIAKRLQDTQSPPLGLRQVLCPRPSAACSPSGHLLPTIRVTPQPSKVPHRHLASKEPQCLYLSLFRLTSESICHHRHLRS